jgi:hypothetical protein
MVENADAEKVAYFDEPLGDRDVLLAGLRVS